MPKLLVIVASTRPGRAGLPISEWFVSYAKNNSDWEVEVADLAEIDLPFLDEPKHPAMHQYEHDHTKRWSELVASADAYIIVTPEYNFGVPAPLVNALDYLYSEWNYKPVGFVSYGGVSGGLRSVQMAKQLVTTLKMMPMYEAVVIPFFSQLMKDGVFEGNELMVESAGALLKELRRWSDALATMRS